MKRHRPPQLTIHMAQFGLSHLYPHQLYRLHGIHCRMQGLHFLTVCTWRELSPDTAHVTIMEGILSLHMGRHLLLGYPLGFCAASLQWLAKLGATTMPLQTAVLWRACELLQCNWLQVKPAGVLRVIGGLHQEAHLRQGQWQVLLTKCWCSGLLDGTHRLSAGTNRVLLQEYWTAPTCILIV